MVIRLEDIEKRYGTRVVFSGMNLSVERGEFLAIMGSSGSGKSTLLNLIGGMDLPDSGKIIVDNEDITAYAEERLTAFRRKKIGFIFQFFNLLPNISVRENIEMPLLLNRKEMPDGTISEYLHLVGLAGRENSLPSQLSGGEQQRVAIVRALIHDPAIILADEPTGNLDSRTGMPIVELIKETAAARNKTIVMVTHNTAVAERADRIIRIQDGMLIR